jgi:hypothetical protein
LGEVVLTVRFVDPVIKPDVTRMVALSIYGAKYSLTEKAPARTTKFAVLADD